MNFMDKVASGRAIPGEIDDYIGRWHDDEGEIEVPLSRFLGMTEEEYKSWVQLDQTVLEILASRNKKEEKP